LLYAAPNSVKRKDDSSTVGRSVGIGNNGKTIFAHWNWRHECGQVCCPRQHAVALDLDRSPWACDTCERVMPSLERFRCLTCDFDLCRECHAAAPRDVVQSTSQIKAALRCVTIDDRKTTVQELHDVPAAEGSLIAMLLAGRLEACKDGCRPRAMSQDSSDLSTTLSGGSRREGWSENGNSDQEPDVRSNHPTKADYCHSTGKNRRSQQLRKAKAPAASSQSFQGYRGHQRRSRPQNLF